jgi:hypothetical protein
VVFPYESEKTNSRLGIIMDGLLNYFRDNYYTDLACLFIAFIGIIVSLRITNASKIKMFRYYFLAFLFLRVFSYFAHYSYYTQNKLSPIFSRASIYLDYFFTVFEFSIFAGYIYNFSYKKIVLYTSTAFYLSTTILFIFYTMTKHHLVVLSLTNLFTIQAVSLLIICISYYIKIFKDAPDLILLNEPSFWIITGLTFFMLSTLPFSLISPYLIRNTVLYRNLFSIFFIFYCILFLMIIRAFLCRQVLAK